jgi:hypothetical protein
VISALHGSGTIATVSLRLLYLIFLRVLGLVVLPGRTASSKDKRRPHRALHLRPPCPERPVPDLGHERIKRRPILGGLINEYEPAA